MEVYRVFSDSHVSQYDNRLGFVAGDPNFDPYYFDSIEDMQIQVTNHLRWGNEKPTPFVSASRSASKTLKWAKIHLQSGLQNVRIAIIDLESHHTAGFRSYTVRQIVEEMGLIIPDDVAGYVGHTERLFEQCIPVEFVKCVLSVEEFEEYCKD
jgi:hypothetical protein